MELECNRGVSWEQAKQVLDTFREERAKDGLPASQTAGWYIEQIKDWGHTSALSLCVRGSADMDICCTPVAGRG